MHKALFLDRDGIINVDTAYLHKSEDVVFVDGIFELCNAAQNKGYIIIVVTNQAGIARGYYSEDDVQRLHDWIIEEFSKRDINIAAIYYSPYHTDGVIKEYVKDSDCRKPNPGMFLKAAKKYNIDFSKSLMVGDKHSDRIKVDELRSIILKSQYTGDDYDVTTLKEIVSKL